MKLRERVENILNKLNIKFEKVGHYLFLFNINGVRYGILTNDGAYMDVAYLVSDDENYDNKQFTDDKILVWIVENLG